VSISKIVLLSPSQQENSSESFQVAKSEEVLISNLQIKAELDEQGGLFCLLPKEEDHGIQLFMTSSDDPKA
jgi:hypothetical protein